MPLKKGRKNFKANLHELRHGPQFQRTARKFGRRRAQAQMIAIALKKAGRGKRRQKK